MARPSSGYEIDGEKVPGVTTITGRFKDSGGLIYWAWQQGKDGKDFRDTKQKAADAGTVAHGMVEADWHGKTFDSSTYPDDVRAKADHAFLAYLEWKNRVNLKVIKPELTLLSKIHKFGGTLDALFVGDKLVLGDWKTSNGIYPDMLVQVAGGYSLLWQEHYPDQPLHGVEIIRFSKPDKADDPITFTDHFWSAEIIPIAQAQFLRFREAYEVDKRLKKLV